MEVEMLKQWNEGRDRTDLKNRELEESLGIALQAIKKLEEMMQAENLGKAGEEQRKPVLEEEKKVDNFTTGKSRQGVVDVTQER